MALVAGYVASDLLLRRIAVASSGIIPWYPGAGLALAFLVLGGTAVAPVLFAARLLLYRWPDASDLPLWVAALEAALQTAAYAVGASVIRERVLAGLQSWRARHAAWLVGVIGATATVAALVSSAEFIGWRGLPASAFWTNLATFAAGDAAGALVVLPALLFALRPLLAGLSSSRHQGTRAGARARSPDAPLSAAGALLPLGGALPVVQAAAVLGALLLGFWLHAHGDTSLTLVALLGPLAWVALRQGLRGAVLVTLVYGLAWGAMALVWGLAPSTVPAVQSLLLTLGVVALLLGAARTETAESAARYWHLLASASEGIWRVDAEGNTLYLNERMAEILGLSVEEAAGREIRDFVLDEDRARWEEERRLRLAGVDSTYEVRARRPDGSVAQLVVNGSVVRSTDTGEPVGSVAIVTDITAARRTEAERQMAQVLLETAFRSSRDAMVIFRASDEQIVDVNDMWCRATGYERADVLGRSQKELRIWGDPADSARLAEAIREHGAVQDFEIAFNRHAPGGVERGYALLSAQPAIVDGVTYLLVSGRDITVERRRADTERQLQRLEELGRMAGSIAHDFNNLLTVVLAYTQFVKGSLAAHSPVDPLDVDEIERAAQRGRELTSRLLAFSRNQPAEPRVVDARDVVDRARGMLQSILPPIVRLEIERSPEPLPVLADPGQMDQILLNLAVNARDAMPNGGMLTISTELLQAPSGEVAEQVGQDAIPGQYVLLRIRDTGCGMEDATLPRIFEPFFTTKPQGEGTGLGLAVVFGIVRQARGVVRVESAVDRGSTFSIFWPTASIAPMPLDVSLVDDDSRAHMTGGRVLLVEDDATVRTITRRILEDGGFEVRAASDGERALRCLDEMEAEGRPPDVVLSDVLMPQLGGRGLAQRLAARRPGLVVVLMTGHAGVTDVREGLVNVPFPVVQKPFNVTELLDVIDAAVARARQG